MIGEEKLRALLVEAEYCLEMALEYRYSDLVEELLPRIVAALAEPMNQCDGCNVGAPIENGIHDYANGSRIGCTRDKYTFSSKEN